MEAAGRVGGAVVVVQTNVLLQDLPGGSEGPSTRIHVRLFLPA